MRPRLLVLAALVGSIACKRDVAPAPPAPTASATAAASAHHDHSHELNLPPVGGSVKVSFAGKSVDVELASIAEGGGVPVPKLWSAAFGAEDAKALRFDFVGSDGFRSTSRDKCTRLLTGAELATAKIMLPSHDLVLDEAQHLPGCYRVRAIVALDVTRAPN